MRRGPMRLSAGALVLLTVASPGCVTFYAWDVIVAPPRLLSVKAVEHASIKDDLLCLRLRYEGDRVFSGSVRPEARWLGRPTVLIGPDPCEAPPGTSLPVVETQGDPHAWEALGDSILRWAPYDQGAVLALDRGDSLLWAQAPVHAVRELWWWVSRGLAVLTVPVTLAADVVVSPVLAVYFYLRSD